jgi:hypothetical protein
MNILAADGSGAEDSPWGLTVQRHKKSGLSVPVKRSRGTAGADIASYNTSCRLAEKMPRFAEKLSSILD